MRSGSRANASGRILSATSRPNAVSRARYTSPIPPAPIAARISYAPRRAPRAMLTNGPTGYSFQVQYMIACERNRTPFVAQRRSVAMGGGGALTGPQPHLMGQDSALPLQAFHHMDSRVWPCSDDRV